MSISIDGNDLIWDGTVTIANFQDYTTGVATLTLTPSGGVGNLPALAQGTPGMPALFNDVTIVPVAWGTTPPAPVLTQVSAGGPGVSSVYNLTMYVNEGSPGTTGDPGIDITGTGIVGDVVTVTADGGFTYSPQLAPNIYEPASLSSVSELGQATGNFATVAIPAQNFDWYPKPYGFAVFGGIGTDMQFRLEARLNSQSGQLVGAVQGPLGLAAEHISLSLVPNYGGTLANAVVPAGQSAIVYFNALQTAPSISAWTAVSTSAGFCVEVLPTLAAGGAAGTVAPSTGTVTSTTQLNNALGQLNTSLGVVTAPNVSTLLGSFTGPVTTTIQTSLDQVANAIGNTGVGHTISQVQGLLSGISQTVQNDIQGTLTTLHQVLGGATIPNVIANLQAFTGTVTQDVQDTLDTVAQAIGNTGLGHTISQVRTALQNLLP